MFMVAPQAPYVARPRARRVRILGLLIDALTAERRRAQPGSSTKG
jgi:hypothetical protein